ncbi:MAG: chemotaxis protein CheA [Caulobacteraceae bacterium]|nr:chemotaxis protein CheA [Caulobacteraceae bacterium]
MDELLAQFLNEGPELAQAGAEALLALERRPGERALVDDAFRAVHTLKGSVGLFDLPDMAAVLHAAEDVLGAMREGRRAVDSTAIDALLAALDHSERSLAALAATGAALPAETDAARRLVERLRGEHALEEPSTTPAPAQIETPAWAEALKQRLPTTSPPGPLAALRYVPDPDCFFRGEDPLALIAAAPGLVHLQFALQPAADETAAFDPFACRLVLEAACTADLTAVKAAFRLAPNQVAFATIGAGTATAGRERASGRALRVDGERLDALAALVDELVAAKTGLSAIAAQATDQAGASEAARRLAERLAAQAGAIDRLVAQAHQRVQTLRMIPLASLLRRFPRLAREMAAGLGKMADLSIDDGGVEADRTVVEGLFEPLTHLLRNAVDHGVEDPGARRALGKPERGSITLTARTQGGQMVIRIEDDGRGIDPDALRARAAERGLADAETLAAMDDAAAAELVFLPGFSTAGAVTALSGRGVGMDAVRAAVRKLGGRVSLNSRRGGGTLVELFLPLSVSLTRVMIVESAGERYGVPMDKVAETVRLAAARISPIRAGHAFDWRGRTVPLAPLSALVGGPESLGPGDQRVLVAPAAGGFVGLAVDGVSDRLDLAVRPLDGLLAGVPGLTGAAVLQNGEVLMVLDPEALAP